MLQAIRDRAQGIFAWVMLLVIGVPFALWGIQNYIDTGKEKPAAVVGDREIFDREVTKAYEQSLNNLVGIADFNEQQLRRDALERIISEEVIVQSAEERSLVVSDAEARDFIQALPYFQTEGKFDKDKYQAMLAAQGMASNQFVAQVRRGLTGEQFQRGVVDSAIVTQNELETLMRLKNQERDTDYVKIPLVASQKNYTDTELNAYYDAHRESFKTPERVSIEYLELDLADIAKTFQIGDDELQSLYEEQKTSLGTPERRKISHILVAVEGADPSADAAALEKAKAALARLNKGEDFAKLAQELSSDTVSAKKGGDLGYLEKDAQEESFTKAASSLAAGGVSEPVRTSFGYHLIKVTELIPAKYPSFAEVKESLRKSAQQNKAESAFYEKGQKLAELTFEHPDSLDTAAQQLGLKVQTAALFTRDAGTGIAADESVRKAAFSEDVLAGRNSDPLELAENKAVVLRVKEHQPSIDKPLAEVKSVLLTQLHEQDARAEAERRAKALLAAVREGKSLAEAVKAQGLQVVHTGFVKRESEKLVPELARAVFGMARPPEGKSTAGEVALPDGSQIVFNLLAVKDGANASPDAKVQQSATEFMERNSSQREFAAFVERLRDLADVHIEKKD